MTWLFAGIIPPILWAIVNHTDKYLLSKGKYQSSVNVLMVYSTLFSLLVLPFLLIFTYDKLFGNWEQVIVQIVGGILMTLSIYFYMMALNEDEASIVIPFALLAPIFGYIFSFVLLGEVLTTKQIISCLIIIFGAFILSLEFNEEHKVRIRQSVLLFMILCTAFQAAQETLFKFVTVDNSLPVSFFWLHVGIAICGFFLLLVRPKLLGQFVYSIKANGRFIFGVCILSETASAVAYMVRDYATLLAPIAIVMTLGGYQPAFVFILGVILTVLFPRFVTEKIKPMHLLHKGLAIAIIIAGTVLIAQTV